MGGTCIPSENHGADMELKRLFEEPYAGKPHVRFREGRTEKSDSVYSTGSWLSPHNPPHPLMRGWGDHEVVEGGGERNEPMPPLAAIHNPRAHRARQASEP